MTFASGTVAEARLDRPPDVAAVAVKRRLLGLVRPQPSVQRCAERRLRPRVALLVDLREQPREDLLRLGLVAGGLGEVVRLAGQRVRTGVDEHLERAAAAADVSTRPAALRAAPGHIRSVPIDTTIDRSAFEGHFL